MMQIDSEAKVYAEVKRCTRAVLLSSTKKEIVSAMTTLECVVRADCICSFCDGTRDMNFVFEFGRCLVPTRTMQLIKERHLETPRWAYVGPVYTRLFATLYEDLNPANDKRVFSNGEMEDIVCRFKLPRAVYSDALAKIQTEGAMRQRFRLANP
jgi:hypothetical protein